MQDPFPVWVALAFIGAGDCSLTASQPPPKPSSAVSLGSRWGRAYSWGLSIQPGHLAHSSLPPSVKESPVYITRQPRAGHISSSTFLSVACIAFRCQIEIRSLPFWSECFVGHYVTYFNLSLDVLDEWRMHTGVFKGIFMCFLKLFKTSLIPVFQHLETYPCYFFKYMITDTFSFVGLTKLCLIYVQSLNVLQFQLSYFLLLDLYFGLAEYASECCWILCICKLQDLKHSDARINHYFDYQPLSFFTILNFSTVS